MKTGEIVRDHYRKQGAETERERIIKLLEERPCDTRAGHPYECICEGFALAIALIKGENK